jgi:holliday junction DNA helicase RuvA
MIEYIKGKVEQLNPAFAVLEAGGLGYFLNISLGTHAKLAEGQEAKLFVHEAIREDAYVLYGFSTDSERRVFRALISVSGIGSNTARMMLSKLSPLEIVSAISTGNINLFKSVKGIGVKSAERVIVDLKDKAAEMAAELGGQEQIIGGQNNTAREEALSALVMLGFPKAGAEKILDKIIPELGDAPVEALVRESLKRL